MNGVFLPDGGPRYRLRAELEPVEVPFRHVEDALTRAKAPELFARLTDKGQRRAVLVVEERWSHNHLSKLSARLEAESKEPPVVLRVPCDDSNRSLRLVETICEFLARERVQRDEHVLLVGNGALLGAGAVACALYNHGTGFAFVPTTLRAVLGSAARCTGEVDLICRLRGRLGTGGLGRASGGVWVHAPYLADEEEASRREGLAFALRLAVLGGEELLAGLEAHGVALLTRQGAAGASAATATPLPAPLLLSLARHASELGAPTLGSPGYLGPLNFGSTWAPAVAEPAWRPGHACAAELAFTLYLGAQEGAPTRQRCAALLPRALALLQRWGLALDWPDQDLKDATADACARREGGRLGLVVPSAQHPGWVPLGVEEKKVELGPYRAHLLSVAPGYTPTDPRVARPLGGRCTLLGGGAAPASLARRAHSFHCAELAEAALPGSGGPARGPGGVLNAPAVVNDPDETHRALLEGRPFVVLGEGGGAGAWVVARGSAVQEEQVAFMLREARGGLLVLMEGKHALGTLGCKALAPGVLSGIEAHEGGAGAKALLAALRAVGPGDPVKAYGRFPVAAWEEKQQQAWAPVEEVRALFVAAGLGVEAGECALAVQLLGPRSEPAQEEYALEFATEWRLVVSGAQGS